MNQGCRLVSTAISFAVPVASPEQGHKGTLVSIARTMPAVATRRHARTGGQRKMSGRLFGYARVSVASNADANNLSTQRRVLADCEQIS